jgi:hypothetical protein
MVLEEFSYETEHPLGLDGISSHEIFLVLSNPSFATRIVSYVSTFSCFGFLRPP